MENPTTPPERSATTPAETDDGASQTMSDSQFNYEMQNNWSMIFTDDNNSTDHDLRSNYSSSLDENGIEHDPEYHRGQENDEDNEDAELVSESGIVSETDSEYPAFRYLATRNVCGNSNSTLKASERFAMDSQEHSAATLKNSTEITEGSYHFPDPLSDSKASVKETTHDDGVFDDAQEKELRLQDDQGPSSKLLGMATLNPFIAGMSLMDYVKSYAVYVVLGLLVLDRSIQLFDLGLPSSKGLFLPPAADLSTQDDDSYNHVTIIRYATKTETYVIADPATTVETVYETVEPTMVPSWKLANQLYSNFVSEAKNVGEAIWDKTNKVTERAAKGAVSTLEQAPTWIEDIKGKLTIGYSSLKQDYFEHNNFSTSIISYAQDKYTGLLDTEWVTAAAKSATSIQDRGVWTELKIDLQNGLSGAVSGLDKLKSQTSSGLARVYDYISHDGVTALGNAVDVLTEASGSLLQVAKPQTFSWSQTLGEHATLVYNDPIWEDLQKKSSSALHSSWSNMEYFGASLYTGARERVGSLDEIKSHASNFANRVYRESAQSLSTWEKYITTTWENSSVVEKPPVPLKDKVYEQIDKALHNTFGTWRWFSGNP